MSHLSPLLAIVVGIVHAGLAPVIVIGGVKPNLVLVAVVLVTSLAGFMPGITWAFVAGLTANLLVGEPLGAVPLVMLIVAAFTAGGARTIGRVTPIYPILAALIGSIAADLGSLAISLFVGGATSGEPPFDVILAAAVLNGAIAGIVLIPARLLVRRYDVDEAPAW